MESGPRHLTTRTILIVCIDELVFQREGGIQGKISGRWTSKTSEEPLYGASGAYPSLARPSVGPVSTSAVQACPDQLRKTASACAGLAAKWRIMLAMGCRGECLRRRSKTGGQAFHAHAESNRGSHYQAHFILDKTRVLQPRKLCFNHRAAGRTHRPSP